MHKLILGITILSLFLSCENPNRTILGKWMMHQVIQDGLDVTEEHNPKKDRYFVMKEDGTFESDGTPYGKNTGKYDFDPIENTLFIDSDGGDTDDSSWSISFEEGKMIWQGKGTEWAERFKIVYVRTMPQS